MSHLFSLNLFEILSLKSDFEIYKTLANFVRRLMLTSQEFELAIEIGNFENVNLSYHDNRIQHIF